MSEVVINRGKKALPLKWEVKINVIENVIENF